MMLLPAITISTGRKRIKRMRHPEIGMTTLPKGTCPLPSIVVESLPSLQLCQRLCDSTDLASDFESKGTKATILSDLDVVFNGKSSLMSPPSIIFQTLFDMIHRESLSRAAAGATSADRGR
jgi:hypothetical protein